MSPANGCPCRCASDANKRRTYPTDLTDAEWECLSSYLPAERSRGRPREHSVREILDAIFYVIRGGCAWRLLPHDFPPWGRSSAKNRGLNRAFGELGRLENLTDEQ